MDNNQVDPALRKLYPHLSDEELLDAEERLLRYMELTLRIYERISNDPETYTKFKNLIGKNKTDKPAGSGQLTLPL